MNRDQALKLADFYLGVGRYNPAKAIAFAQACERVGLDVVRRMNGATEPAAAVPAAALAKDAPA